MTFHFPVLDTWALFCCSRVSELRFFFGNFSFWLINNCSSFHLLTQVMGHSVPVLRRVASNLQDGKLAGPPKFEPIKRSVSLHQANISRPSPHLFISRQCVRTKELWCAVKHLKDFFWEIAQIWISYIFAEEKLFTTQECFPLSDTLIKQQLNSLLYVKTTCEARIQRIKEGLDENDAAVSLFLLEIWLSWETRLVNRTTSLNWCWKDCSDFTLKLEKKKTFRRLWIF